MNNQPQTVDLVHVVILSKLVRTWLCSLVLVVQEGGVYLVVGGWATPTQGSRTTGAIVLS